jgi:transcriptional regulator with XRE-family HTH domain
LAAELLRARCQQGIVDRMLHNEGLSTQSRQEFCLALKAARERNGITLAAIANATKIPASMFAALERNDLRRWPKGLFRRSFFRDYVRMIGVPVPEACAEFLRLFPDHEGAQPAKAAGAAVEANEVNDLSLVLDEAWHGPPAPVLSRLLAALIDGAAVILVAAAFASVAGTDPAATTAIVALAYFSLATALVGESPAKWAMSRSHALLDALRQGPAGVAAAWRRGAAVISNVFAREDGGTPEPVEELEMRPWTTDARRVGPAPRLRVRIKVS